MLKDLLVNEVIPQILYVVITTILGLATYYVKKFLDSRKSFIETQKEQLIQRIGIEKYNQDIAIAKQIVLAVEQMGKNFDWEGAVKKSKAVEIIGQKTGLGIEDIYNIIEATVAEFNRDKKTDVLNLPEISLDPMDITKPIEE